MIYFDYLITLVHNAYELCSSEIRLKILIAFVYFRSASVGPLTLKHKRRREGSTGKVVRLCFRSKLNVTSNKQFSFKNHSFSHRVELETFL